MHANVAQQANSHSSMLSGNSSLGTAASGKTVESLSPLTYVKLLFNKVANGIDKISLVEVFSNYKNTIIIIIIIMRTMIMYVVLNKQHMVLNKIDTPETLRIHVHV